MFIRCESGMGGFIWINVSQVKSVSEIYGGNNEVVGYYVKTVDNLEYRCAVNERTEEILYGGKVR